MWKEEVVTVSVYFVAGWQENHKNLVDVVGLEADVQTQDLSNTKSVNHHHLHKYLNDVILIIPFEFLSCLYIVIKTDECRQK